MLMRGHWNMALVLISCNGGAEGSGRGCAVLGNWGGTIIGGPDGVGFPGGGRYT